MLPEEAYDLYRHCVLAIYDRWYLGQGDAPEVGDLRAAMKGLWPLMTADQRATAEGLKLSLYGAPDGLFEPPREAK